MSVPLLTQDEFFRHLELQSVHSNKARFTYRQALKERLRATTRKDSLSLPKTTGKRVKTASKEKPSVSEQHGKREDDGKSSMRGPEAPESDGEWGGASTSTKRLLASPKSCRRIVAKHKKHLVGKDDKAMEAGQSGSQTSSSSVSSSASSLTSSSSSTSTSMFDAAERLFRTELEAWELEKIKRKRRLEAGEPEFQSMIVERRCHYVDKAAAAAKVTPAKKVYRARLLEQTAGTADERRTAPPPEILSKALHEAVSVVMSPKTSSSMVRVNYCKRRPDDPGVPRRRLKKFPTTKKLFLPTRSCRTATAATGSSIPPPAASAPSAPLRGRRRMPGILDPLNSSGDGRTRLLGNSLSPFQMPPSPPPSSAASDSDQSTRSTSTSATSVEGRRTRSHAAEALATMVTSSSSARDPTAATKSSSSSSISNRVLFRRQKQLRLKELQQERLKRSQHNQPSPPQQTSSLPKERSLKRPLLLPADKISVLTKATGGDGNGFPSFSVATPAAAADLLYFHKLVLGRTKPAVAGGANDGSSLPVRCGICSKSFPTRSKMIRHTLAVHADQMHKVDLAEFINGNSRRRAWNRLWEGEVET